MAGAFAALLAKGSASGELGRVTLAFEAMIAKSFETHPMRHMTRAEVKRRFDMCARIFDRLCGDLHWGVTRALDQMPTYLRSELDGVSWTPDKRRCWVPSDGR